MAAPQAPAGGAGAAPAREPSEAIAHADAFPEDTLACVSLTATQAQRQELARHPVLRALLDRLLPAPPVAGAVDAEALDARLHAATGIRLSQWLSVLHGGLTVGLVGIGDAVPPQWLLVVDALDQAGAFAALLDRLRQAPGTGATVAEDGKARTWLVVTPLGRIAFALHDNRIVAGDCAATVQSAVTRLTSRARAGTLVSTSGFADFRLATSVQPSRLLAAWIRPNLLGERALTALSSAAAGKVRSVLRALDVTRIAGFGITVAREGNDLVEAYHLDWPAPRNGPLAEMLAPRAVLRAEAATLIPADADSFSASAINLQSMFHASMRLLGELLPREADRIQAGIAQWNERLGVDLQDELLGRVGSQLVTMQWGSGDSAESAAMLQLTDAPQFERTLRRALGAASAPLREASVNGYRTFVLDGVPGEISFTVTEESLVFAMGGRSMQRALEQLAAPRGTQAAVTIPTGASAYGVVKLHPILARLEALVERAGTSGVQTSVVRAVSSAAGAGSMATVSSRDDRNVTLQTRSPVGGALTLGLLVAGATVLPDLLASSAQGLAAAATPPDLHRVLAKIVAAANGYRSANAGATLTLQGLVEQGLLAPAELGTAIETSVFERGGYRLSVLNEGSQCIAVAWPAQQRTGPVFAATAEYPALVNDVMAGTVGLHKVEIADIYSKGVGSPMRSGWRVVASTAASPPASAPPAPGGTLASAVASLASASGDREEALAQLRAALTADDPARVAYAAHAVGEIGLTHEVPALLTLVTKHPSLDVRTHAMWALLQLADPRSKQTSIDALTSSSPALRAFAAANLGKLRAREATQALLGLLPQGKDSDDRDRVSALLALADIGDPAPLLQAAAAVTEGSPATVQALAYAFQTLSCKLAPKDEATTLVAALDHPQPILRRYAIQRLGELREPATARALEGRLGREDRELLPLVQVSLQAVRRDPGHEERSFGATLGAIATRVRTTWERLAPNQRYAVFAGLGAIAVTVLLLSVLRGRGRARGQAEAWAAMAAPPTPAPMPAAPGGATSDEVELSVGDSGVYSPHDHDDDALLQSRTRQWTGSRR